jgi:ribosomal protein L11 methyltransferase
VADAPVLVVTPGEVDADLAIDAVWMLEPPPVAVHERDDGALVVAFATDRDRVAAFDTLADRFVVSTAIVDDGLDGWRDFATVTRVGEQVVLRPSWVPYDASPAEIVVELDPGRAFGSGAHATTRLCAEAIVALVRPGMRVADVGSGSGVLSVLAALLGAEVQAVDVDPAAIEATAANAAVNGVSVAVRAGSVDALDGPADLVVANLLAPVVRALAVELCDSVAPGGRLVVSGLLVEHWDGIVPSLAPLVPVAVHELDGWVAVWFDAPGS